jgi:hypothetical protein
MLRAIALGCLVMLAAPAAGQERAAATDPDGAARMTLRQIAEYNANLAPADPAYIKCVKTEGPGSWVKRRVCRTNADWSRRADQASREAREIVDSIQLHGSSASQEPVGSIVPLTPN